MIVQYIEQKYVDSVWDSVKPFIESALEHTDDYNAEQCKMFLTSGHWVLFVAVEHGILCGVATIFIERGVNHKTALITTISGKGIINKDAMGQLMNLLRSAGIDRVQGFARDSLVRLYQRFGLEKKANLVEFKL
jgi:hypothetical protein